MTPATAPAFRTVAFGDLETGLWGVAVATGSPAATATAGADSVLAAIADGDSSTVLAGACLAADGPQGEWRITADGAELVLSPASDVVAAAPGGAPAGFDQLCRVRGQVRIAGAERSLDCLGHRGERDAPAVERFGSVRDIALWLDAGEGAVLTALRPRKAADHGADVISAAVFEPDRCTAVADPRLSTTYTGDGDPARASLELWIGEEESEQYLRRFAGEAVGHRLVAEGEPGRMLARLLHCHGSGGDGTGVYLLLTRR